MKDTVITIMLFVMPFLLFALLEWSSKRDDRRRRARDKDYLRELGVVLAAVDGRGSHGAAYGSLIAATFTDAARRAQDKR